jgi:ribokinase
MNDGLTRATVPKCEIAVVGSLNLDRILNVVELPQDGDTVRVVREDFANGGKGANQAVVAARLGGRVALVGAIGDDEAGRYGRAALEDAGVDTEFLRVTPSPTGSATVIVDRQGRNFVVVDPGANHDCDEQDVRVAVASRITGSSVIVTNFEVPMAAVIAAAKTAKSYGATVVVNPAPAVPLPTELVVNCDVLVPNEVELARLGYTVEHLLARGVAMVVTRGAAGADLYLPGQERFHADAYKVNVVDTTGAGDAFVGALARMLQKGVALPAACTFACATASLSTTATGARGYLPSEADVRSFIAVS